tara:strand:- start:781 stop:1203 length:423 start_codon:yes stop_codon:yes gene_type:complete
MVTMRIINMPTKFDEFWSIYPRKKDKKRARISFNRLPAKTQQECIDGVKKYIKEIDLKGRLIEHVKHPSTFINGENWEDEFETEVIINQKVHSTDFKLDATGNARIGYCGSCNKSDFYDKYQIHQESSRCCGKDLIPCRA